MTKTLYVTEGPRLVGIQDVSRWTSRQIGKMLNDLFSIGRSGEVSESGCAACCVCGAYLGKRDGIPAGKISHGYCDKCFEKALKEV